MSHWRTTVGGMVFSVDLIDIIVNAWCITQVVASLINKNAMIILEDVPFYQVIISRKFLICGKGKRRCQHKCHQRQYDFKNSCSHKLPLLRL